MSGVLDGFSLAGRTALVTGGNRGLGEAFARGLAEAGARVMIASRDAAQNEIAIEKLRADGLQAWGTADAGPNVVAITRPADAAAVADALAGHGAVRVVRPGPGASLVDERVAPVSTGEAR